VTAGSRRVAVAAGLLATLLAAAARAAPPEPARLFADGVAALERGAFDEAVDRFEALADGGFVHPDASFDRAAAYLGRGRSPQARPGDLGQVVAALTEVVNLRPEDAEAARALELVRTEIANRRLRAGLEPGAVSVSIGRAVVGLLDEATWLVAAALGSLLAALGLGARAWTARPAARLAGGVTASLGAGLLLVAGAFAAAAGQYRRGSTPAVVVVPQARLLTADGAPLDPKTAPERRLAAPEGALLFVTERRGRLLFVQWGTTRGHVASSDVRLLAER